MEIQSAQSAFQAIWVAPSIILTLGITRICSDTVSLIRSRHRVRMDWIPLVWAMCIFIWQIQYLWAIIELPRLVHTWALSDFVALLSLSLALFFAAALVLPDHELNSGADLEDNFMQDGRWALIALSVWGVIGLLVDVLLFSEPLLSLKLDLMIIVAMIPVLYLAIKNRLLRALITVGNLLLTLWVAWLQSPKAY